MQEKLQRMEAKCADYERDNQMQLFEPPMGKAPTTYITGLDPWVDLRNSIDKHNEKIVASYKGISKEEGLKYDSNKVRMDLLPHKAIKEIAEVYTFGASKYGDRNWEKGIKWSRLYGALQRHIQAFWEGKDFDEESSKKHLAHAGCCLTMLLEAYKLFPQLDDRPNSYLNTPKIGLDIDEVLCDFTQGWANLHKGVDARPNSWFYHREMGAKFKEMKENGTLNDFYMGLSPKVNPKDIPFEPHCYVTSRPIDTSITEAWLKKHKFPEVKVYTVPVGASKVEIMKESGIDIFVDDRFENFVELNKAGICCFLWDAPHNQRYEVGYKRIKDFKQLIE